MHSVLSLKQLAPVRLVKNKFFEHVEAAEKVCATQEELKTLLGKGRSKKGMFEGDMDEGELEIGQVSAGIRSIKPVSEIISDLITEFEQQKENLVQIKF